MKAGMQWLRKSGAVGLASLLLASLLAPPALRAATPEAEGPRFDVIVASNLFGDILSDLGSALGGSLGIAASANIDPERRWPSMFEPVHGSAPDIAGQGIANPIAAIWTAALMLDHLGLAEEASRVMRAIEATTAAGIVTPDLGGGATTREVGEAVAAEL